MQENNIDLLNLSQPWDCQRFPKSKTICYGGSSGTSTGDNYYVKKAAKQSGYTGSDLDKAGQATEKAVTGGVKKAEETVKAATDVKPPPVLKKASEGFDEFGRRIKKGASDTIENIKSGASSTIESVKSDIARSDLGSGAIETAIKRSDLGSGAIEEAIKRSDVGIVTEQAKDVLNAPGIYVGKKLEEFKKYAKDRLGMGGGDDSGSSGASTGSGPGTGATIGAGGTSGLRVGAQMKSGRQRAKQNKRALRISRRS